jgi:hypothetical protein
VSLDQKRARVFGELFLGVCCTFKGFRPESPILGDDACEERVTAAAVRAAA